MVLIRRLAWGSFGVASIGASVMFGQLLLADETDSQLDFEKLLSQERNKRIKTPLSTRKEQITALRNAEKPFDVLVIGGGITGAGCALDAVSRGLHTALVERDDFSAGTSSRSTKLIHGGVRYLQKAILHFDVEQYNMVKEALHERANLLKIAPHLSFPLPIMLPVYKWWQVPYFWAGIKAYDLVSGRECLKSSYFLNKDRALEMFSMLKKDKLKGAIVYYDGSHNDSRMCLSVTMSAVRRGAVVTNHVEVTDLIKDSFGQVIGVALKDNLTGETWKTYAKSVINATGPFTDSIRKMDDPQVSDIVCASAGVHVVLPDYYSPANMGLLDPETKDGRVIFFLPWQGLTIAGTTDSPCEVSASPAATETDIQFILNEVRNYLAPDVNVRRGDILSAWSGIRPLVKDPSKSGSTQALVRNHVVHRSNSGLVTIAGGKWTTYRAMASDTLDLVISSADLSPAHKTCQTDGLLLEGSHEWTPTLFIRLIQDLGLESDVASHLAATYGDRAFAVGRLASLTGKRWPIVGKKLHPEFPYIEAEIRYACRVEYAMTTIDVIARRLRLSFLNVQACEEALSRIIEIMAEELKWDKIECKKQYVETMDYLNQQMGRGANQVSHIGLDMSSLKSKLSESEIAEYTKNFNSLDIDSKGFVSLSDIRRSLKDQGSNITGQDIHQIMVEIDTDKNGVIHLEEYLQMMYAIKTGSVSHSRFHETAKLEASRLKQIKEDSSRRNYGENIERSGGGL